MRTGSPKYRFVYDALARDIASGKLKRGDRLPSEAALGRAFEASRITVGRAVRDLQLQGLVERRAGSGTYVASTREVNALSFGLLIPDLGDTDIFEPMCQGMMASPLARNHALIWGSPSGADSSRSDRAWQLCQLYIDRGVAGVFFAPLEHSDPADDINVRISAALDAARIPVVLLDRTVDPYPKRGHHDLVGIDNRRAGFIVTDHLIKVGSQRVAFVAEPRAAATVDAREAGYREALFGAGSRIDPSLTERLDPTDQAAVEHLMSTARPDGIVCANDRTAGRLMKTLLQLEYAIPSDVRLIGIDDVDFAAMLPVPLTTLRQPTRQIGEVALGAMLERIARRSLPARDVLLDVELIVRESCGAREGSA
jgi:DNA-binding LacI/PurR family transcriptional regulator